MKILILYITILFLPFAETRNKLECTKQVFKETIEEMTGFTNSQLETLDNLSPETKKKLRISVMDVLESLGLLLEISVSPSFSLSSLPVYILRTQHLMTSLGKDMENLGPEKENLSDSLEEFKRGLTAVVNKIPMKAMKCFQ